MLQNWLVPLDPQSLETDRLRSYQFGKHLHFLEQAHFDLRSTQIAIIGLEAASAHAVRQALYSFAWSFGELSVADLGNVRRTEPAFLVPLLRELLDGNIFPLLIGSDPKLVQAQYQAFLQLKPSISFALVDENIPLSARKRKDPNLYLNDLVHGDRRDLFHLSLLGSQIHHTDPQTIRFLDRHDYECIRLGQARADVTELEPTLRDADLVAFNLNCLRAAETPGLAQATPSGFFTEEACRICRYAGMSDKLRSFGLFGLPAVPDTAPLANQVAAQLLWYFLDGFHNRKQDYPVSTQGLTEYIVSFKSKDTQLTFWKSNRSGRWWLQAPVETDQAVQRHRLIPCSYRDYQSALREELPDRLVQAFRRFL